MAAPSANPQRSCCWLLAAFVNRGNVVRHSTFRHIRNEGKGCQGNKMPVSGLYLDDQTSGWSAYNNTFVDIAMGGKK